MGKKTLCFTFVFLFFLASVFCQASLSYQPHRERIQDIAAGTDDFYTCGDDGFVIHWDGLNEAEHYQISDLEIKLIAVSPNGNDIAVYETDGFAINRVSVWNWKTLTRKFAKRFSDSIESLSYTQKGTYITVGTSSIEGLIFLDANRGDPLPVLKEKVDLVKLAKTGKTEKSIITYSSDGTIAYYYLTDGSKFNEFNCPSNLNNPMLIHNNRYLIGTKNSKIVIVDATNGQVETELQSSHPVLLENSENDLYFIEGNAEKNCLSIYSVPLSKGDNQFTKKFIKNFDMKTQSPIDKAILVDEKFYISTKSGQIAFTDKNPTEKIELAYIITENPDKKITDIEIVDNEMLILADNSLYHSEIMNSDVKQIASNIKSKNISIGKDFIILWSKDNTGPVYRIHKYEQQYGQLEQIFSTDLPINSLNICGDKIVIVSGNSKVSIFENSTQAYTDIYKGTGIQDALILDNFMYVSKASFTNPNSPLISVDLTTRETVPLPVRGEVIFGMCSRDSGESPAIYGISNSSSDGKKLTEVFTYICSTKSYQSIISWNDEDTVAFLRYINGNLYTNIGKSTARAVNLSSRKSMLLKRSASLPVKITGNDNCVATLNKDGSITWYDTSSYAKLENWYMNYEGNIEVK